MQQTDTQRLELEYRLKLTKEVEGVKEQLEKELEQTEKKLKDISSQYYRLKEDKEDTMVKIQQKSKESIQRSTELQVR